jgi:DNA replication licensing factor MCM4
MISSVDNYIRMNSLDNEPISCCLHFHETDFDINNGDNQVVIWGTDVHVNECKHRFISFVRKFHLTMEEAHIEGVDPLKSFYMQKLEEIHLLERPFLNVNCEHMKQIDPIILEQLLAYPQEVIPIFDIAVNELFFSIYENDTLPHQIQVRPYNADPFTTMRCLDPEGLPFLLSFEQSNSACCLVSMD